MFNTTTLDDTTLNIHAASDGTVWEARASRPPSSTGATPAEYVASPGCLAASRVRVIGCHPNLALIRGLYPLAQAGMLRVELGGPRIGRVSQERDDPRVLLSRMRECAGGSNGSPGLPASLGGWHALTPATYPAYELAHALEAGADDQALGPILGRHPAWSALTFVVGLTPRAVAATIAAILDPRWFVDPAEPARTGALALYLGLSPEVFSGARPRGGKARRGFAALRAWKRGEEPPDRFEVAPGAFLWRKHRARKGPGWLADLRVTQAFVNFLRLVWLDAIYRDRCNDPLFVVGDYFDEIDALAYRAHMARFDYA